MWSSSVYYVHVLIAKRAHKRSLIRFELCACPSITLDWFTFERIAFHSNYRPHSPTIFILQIMLLFLFCCLSKTCTSNNIIHTLDAFGCFHRSLLSAQFQSFAALRLSPTVLFRNLLILMAFLAQSQRFFPILTLSPVGTRFTCSRSFFFPLCFIEKYISGIIGRDCCDKKPVVLAPHLISAKTGCKNHSSILDTAITFCVHLIEHLILIWSHA